MTWRGAARRDKLQSVVLPLRRDGRSDAPMRFR